EAGSAWRSSARGRAIAVSLPRVERLHQEMRSARRAALDDMAVDQAAMQDARRKKGGRTVDTGGKPTPGGDRSPPPWRLANATRRLLLHRVLVHGVLCHS